MSPANLVVLGKVYKTVLLHIEPEISTKTICLPPDEVVLTKPFDTNLFGSAMFVIGSL